MRPGSVLIVGAACSLLVSCASYAPGGDGSASDGSSSPSASVAPSPTQVSSPPGDPSPPADPTPSAAELAALRATIDRFATDIDSYWKVAFPRTYFAAYRPGLRLVAYTGRDDAPLCAGYRLRTGNAYYCAEEDYIAWDERGLMLPFYREAGDFGVGFVLAHEWGHAVAARARANLPLTIFGELQADCFAGAYAAWADRSGLLDPGDIDEAVLALYRVRDPVGTPWADPSAHGSALDRIRAFTAGHDFGPERCTEFSLPEPPFPPPLPTDAP